MKKYIIILSIFLFACNNRENLTPQLVIVSNQHGDIDTFNIPTDTTFTNTWITKGFGLDGGDLCNSSKNTVLSGVFYYRVISSSTIKHKSLIIDFQDNYNSSPSQNKNYPDTLISYQSNDTIHLKPCDKRFKRLKRT